MYRSVYLYIYIYIYIHTYIIYLLHATYIPTVYTLMMTLGNMVVFNNMSTFSNICATSWLSSGLRDSWSFPLLWAMFAIYRVFAKRIFRVFNYIYESINMNK